MTDSEPKRRAVTKVEFYAALDRDPRDIMPRNTFEDRTVWETKDRVLWGVSRPGWRHPGEPQSFHLVIPEGRS